MMGPTHRLFGAICGAAYASATGAPLHVMAFTAIAATATSNGPFSPDGDQCGPWVALRRLSGPLSPLLNHRSGITHWWGLPAAAWWVLETTVPENVQWPWIGLLIGWVSHLLGDFVFGRIHLFPWGGPSFGLGFKTNGFLEAGRVGSWSIPFGPTRLALAVALVAVFLIQPGMPDLPDLIATARHSATT